MKVLIYAAHLLQVCVILALGTVNSSSTPPTTHGASNCHPYSASELDTSQCPDELRAQQMVTPPPTENYTTPEPTAFRDIYNQLTDATNQEQTPKFALLMLISMYQTLHCASEMEAVADLFYNVSPSRLPDNQSPFWIAAYYALHTTTTSSSDTYSGGIPVVGRRKRQLDASFEALMTHLTQQIIMNAHPSCVQWLINEFRAFAADQFKRAYPSFPNPNAYPLGTITDAPTHTTHPHTPHTTHPTTTTTKATTTTTARPTTPTTTSATCTICSSLDCFLLPSVTSCPQSGQEFCLTTVMSSGSGHQITRGCATRAECDSASWRNNPACVGVDTHMLQLSVGVTCHFCCHGNNCNQGPQLQPLANTMYHAP